MPGKDVNQVNNRARAFKTETSQDGYNFSCPISKKSDWGLKGSSRSISGSKVSVEASLVLEQSS